MTVVAVPSYTGSRPDQVGGCNPSAAKPRAKIQRIVPTTLYRHLPKKLGGGLPAATRSPCQAVLSTFTALAGLLVTLQASVWR